MLVRGTGHTLMRTWKIECSGSVQGIGSDRLLLVVDDGYIKLHCPEKRLVMRKIGKK
jgi:hypothetical protein